MEFLETHASSAAKAVWKNDIDIPTTVTEKSDDESKDDKSEESGDDENGEKENKEEKIADKVISDLEVHHNSHYFYIIFSGSLQILSLIKLSLKILVYGSIKEKATN